jgi:hypothetical protein
MDFQRAHASAVQSLDQFSFIWCEFELESGQIFLHVLTIRSPGQRQQSGMELVYRAVRFRFRPVYPAVQLSGLLSSTRV